jgi:hypothetical protein
LSRRLGRVKYCGASGRAVTHRTIGTVKTLRPLTTSMTPSVPNGVFYRCRRAIRAETVE